MKLNFSRSYVVASLIGLFVITSISVSGVHSMYPYDPDPAVAAGSPEIDKDKSGKKAEPEAELTGDALRDKIIADPASPKNGELRFAQNCAAYCHGDRGAGGEVHPLQCQPEYDAEYLFAVISEGRRSGSRYMPSWKDTFSEKERWELAAFILSLQNLPKCK